MVDFTCTRCGRSADLGVLGRPLAQLDDGLVFDVGAHAMPDKIQCPHCLRVLGKAA